MNQLRTARAMSSPSLASAVAAKSSHQYAVEGVSDKDTGNECQRDNARELCQ